MMYNPQVCCHSITQGTPFWTGRTQIIKILNLRVAVDTFSRDCPTCKTQLSAFQRLCPACKRFVSGGPNSRKGFALDSLIVLLPSLILLAVKGYIWVAAIGFLGEALLWGIALKSKDDEWRITWRAMIPVFILTLLVFALTFFVIWTIDNITS